MTGRPRARSGFTLLELLIVVSLLTIMAAIALPSAAPSVGVQLASVAEVVAGDLAYGRSLAILNNDTYQFLFDVVHNQYTLEYSGSNSSLATLPPNPFHASQDSATQFVVRVAQLPHIGPTVSLYDVQELTPSPVEATSVQFGPTGATTQTPSTVVWLTAGTGTVARYVSVTINPATGLCSIGTLQATAPTTGSMTSGGTTSGS
jgi:prepilin-type N-terminal cleavage/methylation domain-containing protein